MPSLSGDLGRDADGELCVEPAPTRRRDLIGALETAHLMRLLLLTGRGRQALRAASRRCRDAGEQLWRRMPPTTVARGGWSAIRQRALFWNPWCGLRTVLQDGSLDEAHFRTTAALAPQEHRWRSAKPRCRVVGWDWHGRASAEAFCVFSPTSGTWEPELQWFCRQDAADAASV